MNEQIKQLAEQAGVYFGEAHKDYFGEKHPAFIDASRIDVKKFAELIVRECGVIAYKTYCQTPGALGIQYKQAIQEHFGVEE